MARNRNRIEDYRREESTQITITLPMSQYKLLEQFAAAANRTIPDVTAELFGDHTIPKIQKMLTAQNDPSKSAREQLTTPENKPTPVPPTTSLADKLSGQRTDSLRTDQPPPSASSGSTTALSSAPNHPSNEPRRVTPPPPTVSPSVPGQRPSNGDNPDRGLPTRPTVATPQPPTPTRPPLPPLPTVRPAPTPPAEPANDPTREPSRQRPEQP